MGVHPIVAQISGRRDSGGNLEQGKGAWNSLRLGASCVIHINIVISKKYFIFFVLIEMLKYELLSEVGVNYKYFNI